MGQGAWLCAASGCIWVGGWAAQQCARGRVLRLVVLRARGSAWRGWAAVWGWFAVDGGGQHTVHAPCAEVPFMLSYAPAQVVMVELARKCFDLMDLVTDRKEASAFWS